MFALRRALPPRTLALPRRTLHTTGRLAVAVGDRIPDVELMESSPGTKVNLARELQNGKGLIVGVPAAFSPACSAEHVPGYVRVEGLAGKAGKVFVVSVNDAFVMKAWADSLDPQAKSGIRFLADPNGSFSRALDLSFDGSAIFGGPRSKRFALVVDNGVVVKAHVEPDNTGLKESIAEKVLGSA